MGGRRWEGGGGRGEVGGRRGEVGGGWWVGGGRAGGWVGGGRCVGVPSRALSPLACCSGVSFTMSYTRELSAMRT